MVFFYICEVLLTSIYCLSGVHGDDCTASEGAALFGPFFDPLADLILDLARELLTCIA